MRSNPLRPAARRRSVRRANGVRPQRGFSLLELAIGLVILALVAVGMTASLTKLGEQRRITDTRAAVAGARDALLAFAAVQGRLPCPATAATNGQEAIAANVGGVITCAAQSGFLPAVTLGLSGVDENGLLLDAWADGSGVANGTHLRALRYHVSALAAPVADALTSPALGAPGSLTRRVDVQASVNAGQGLFVCRSAAGIGAGANRCGAAPNTLAQNAAAAIFSRGMNGSDLAAYSADENQNANQAVARVVIHRDTAPAGAVGGSFDDIVAWVSYPEVAATLLRGGFVQ